MIRPLQLGIALGLMAGCSAIWNSNAMAEDWPRFRGLAGNGVAADSSTLPTQWSPSANVAWKAEMPGPGASSPIIVGGKVFVTCYSGYGLTQEEPGEIESLVRHLVCLDLQTGEPLWQKDVQASLPEDPYSGIGVTAHGYASHTPVSDGTNVYAFFGKSGVHAFDLDGNELWNADAGKESDPTKWGSSSSPIVFEDTVIVTASAESQAIIGFDKATGKEVWRQEAAGLDGMWGTPTLVKVDDTRTDLVMCVAKELWGMAPSTGAMRWYADATGAQHAYSSVILDGKRVYAFTGRGGGSIALDAGGSGDVSESNTVWTSTENASFASPVRHESKLYVVSRGVLTVVDAETGEKLEQIRLKGVRQTGGRFGSLDYPSPIVVGDRLMYLNGSGQMFVMSLGDKTEQVAVNLVTTDKEKFWGTPAVSDDRLVMRSSKYVYCVTDKGEQVMPSDLEMANANDTDEPAAGGPGRGRDGDGRESGGRAEGGRPEGGRPEGGRPEGGRPEGGRPGGAGRPGGNRGGGGRWDPISMFNGMDADKDGKVSMAELEGNRMADRLKTLDKNGDESISAEEFRSGVGALFSGGGRGGKDSRPDRPQRPAPTKS